MSSRTRRRSPKRDSSYSSNTSNWVAETGDEDLISGAQPYAWARPVTQSFPGSYGLSGGHRDPPPISQRVVPIAAPPSQRNLQAGGGGCVRPGGGSFASPGKAGDSPSGGGGAGQSRSLDGSQPGRGGDSPSSTGRAAQPGSVGIIHPGILGARQPGRSAGPTSGSPGTVRYTAADPFQAAQGYASQPTRTGPAQRGSQGYTPPPASSDEVKTTAQRELLAVKAVAYEEMRRVITRVHARETNHLRSSLSLQSYAQKIKESQETDLRLLKPWEEKIAALERLLGLPPTPRLS
jgi:hypothetical protein